MNITFFILCVVEGFGLFEFSDLTAHFESFLFQNKATLDMLIKLLNPLYEKCHPQLRQLKTFGNKGERVITNLDNFYQRSNSNVKNQIKHSLDLLKKERNTTNWLDRVIDARDTISHYKKNEIFAYQVNLTHTKNKGTKLTIIPPRETEDQTIRDFLKIIRYNLLILKELARSPNLDSKSSALPKSKSISLKFRVDNLWTKSLKMTQFS